MAGVISYRRAGESFEILRDGAVVGTLVDEALARLLVNAEWAASILLTLGECDRDGFEEHQPSAIVRNALRWLHAVWPDDWPDVPGIGG